jgi:uncharacterized membrane protein YkvA (DUF1232 family)
MTNKTFEPDPEKIAAAVERSKTRAEEYLKDPDKSKRLLDDAIKKVKNKEKHHGPVVEMWQNLKTVFRLLKAYFNKEYTAIPWGSIVLIVGAVIYFVSPFDLIPDWIPVAGFIDDAAVLMFVLRQINADLTRFLLWEAEKETSNAEKIIDVALDQKP